MDWNQVRQTPKQNGWSSIRNFISSAASALGTSTVKSLANIGALGANTLGNVQMALNKPESALKSYDRALAARQYAGTEGSFDQGFKSGAGTLVKGGLSALQTALTASGLKYITPAKLLTTGVLGGGISKVMGGDFSTGAGQAVGSLPQILGFVGASNPILAKYLPKNTRLNDRVVGAVGNAAQGVAMDLARGTPTTLGSVGLDLASGAVTGTAGFNGLDIPNAKGISPDVWTSDRNILNEAMQRIRVGETIDEFSETGKAIKNMYKEYGLASYPNWNKLSQSQQVNVLSERLDEMARNGFNIKMGITDQPIKTGGDELINEARKYKSAEEFVNAKIFRDAHAAPGFDDTPVKQRMEEGGDYNLLEVVKGQHNQPSDYFDTKVGPRYYMYDDQQGMESLTAINNVKRGAKTVTAYRVVPKSVKVDKFIDGDWISFSKQYALDHGEHRFGEGTYKIIKQEVPAKDVWWDGNDIREWGYDTGKTKNLSRSELTNIWNKANLSPESGSKVEGKLTPELETLLKNPDLQIQRLVEPWKTAPQFDDYDTWIRSLGNDSPIKRGADSQETFNEIMAINGKIINGKFMINPKTGDFIPDIVKKTQDELIGDAGHVGNFDDWQRRIGQEAARKLNYDDFVRGTIKDGKVNIYFDADKALNISDSQRIEALRTAAKSLIDKGQSPNLPVEVGMKSWTNPGEVIGEHIRANTLGELAGIKYNLSPESKGIKK